MGYFNHVRERIKVGIGKLQENSLDSLVLLVNIIPCIVGFDIYREKISIPFWILHLSLLTYVYGIGCIVYQARDAEVASDFIKSFVNVSILALTINNSYWFLTQRQLLKKVLKKAKETDNYVVRSGLYLEKHERSLALIKRILFMFYGLNLTNEFMVYMPKRMNLNKETFSMTLCVGLEPLTSSPNREICKAFLCLQELTIPCVVLNYQTMMLLLVAHTAVMYQILSDEIMTFNTELDDHRNYESVRDTLSVIICRHALILEITDDLKNLYNMPMGVNFGSNAVCMCFFFFLTFEEYLGFMPVVVYCFLVFFLYCFLCQRLTNAAEMFARAIYSCGWEKMNVKEQKAVYTMLLQAQKPVELLAADLIPVNMYTFGSTIQAIYKFTTVVKL